MEPKPNYHQEVPQSDISSNQKQEPLGMYFHQELGRTLRGFGHTLLWMLTAPGHVPDTRQHQSEESPQSLEPPPPQNIPLS